MKTKRWLNWLGLAVLTALALLWLVPLIWSVLVSVRPADESIVQGNIFFGSSITGENFGQVLQVADWGQMYVTSIIFVLGTLAAQIVTITLAGYAFARMKFLWRHILFILVLVQLMIPSAVLLVPNFATISYFHLFDTKIGLILPFFGSC